MVALTDDMSNRVEHYRYGPFGETEGTSVLGNPIRYTGRFYDETTGLYDNRLRNYHPVLGRFIEPDPIGPAGGINLYAYVNSNPINFIDPLGLSAMDNGGVGSEGGLFAEIGLQVGVVGAGGSASAVKVILAFEPPELVLMTRHEAAGSLVVGGIYGGRGISVGGFVGPIDSHLNSDALNVNSPVGGASLYFGPSGENYGAALGGPSLGLGASFVGPAVGSPSAGVSYEIFRVRLAPLMPINDPITGAPILPIP